MIKAASDDEPARDRGPRLSRRALALERKPCSLKAGIGSNGVVGGASSGSKEDQVGAAGTFCR